jgi:hypothetical protein
MALRASTKENERNTMILLAIILGLFVIGFFFCYRSWKDEPKGWMGGYCMFVGMFGTIIYFFASVIILNTPLAKPTMLSDIKIISMSNYNDVEGSFVLGTGSIRGERRYFYKIQYEDGGIREYTAPVWGTTIYEVSDSPHLQRYRMGVSSDITFINTDHQNNDFYKFYVPKGCIVKEFIIQ